MKLSAAPLHMVQVFSAIDVTLSFPVKAVSRSSIFLDFHVAFMFVFQNYAARNDRNLRVREGFFSLRNAFASI